MIEGDDDGDAESGAKAHNMEEECLFFVALSRARTHLRLYLCRKQPNGNNRSPSPYLDWLTGREVDGDRQPRDHAVAGATRRARRRLPSPGPKTGVSPTHGCAATSSAPRRFFYTHVLGLGSARKTTAFTQTHDCLYELIRWLADARIDGAPGPDEAAQEFERVWAAKGPVEHGFAADYRRLADRLVTALVRSGAGARFLRSEPLAIDLAGGRVIVEPNEMAELPNGTVVLRRIRTGYQARQGI